MQFAAGAVECKLLGDLKIDRIAWLGLCNHYYSSEFTECLKPAEGFPCGENTCINTCERLHW